MPIEGKHKQRNNFISERIRQQKEFWPAYVEQWDADNPGKRFRSEIMSLTELWNLYLSGVSIEPNPEEESRGKKNQKIDKISEVIPIKAFELPGRYFEKFIDSRNVSFHTKEGWGYLHFDQWLYARDRARKDLYWLCKEVLNMDLDPDVHQVVCDQFVTKNFDGVYKEDYSLRDFHKALTMQSRVPQHWAQSQELPGGMSTRQYGNITTELVDCGEYVRDPIEAEKKTNQAKTMILLDPRGFMKSSIDVADCIQWVINCPDIRILIVSGVKKLGDQFMVGVKQGPKGKSFYLPKGVGPSPFHQLFPEYVIRGVDGTSKEEYRVHDSVRRHLSLDPTLGIISVGSSLSGFHCDILKFDDIVTDDNCLSEDAREAILLKADGAVNLLMDWGWHDVIGTRYYPDDYYGQTEATHKKDPEMFNLKFFSRQCWYVKPEFKEVEERSLYDLKEDMVVLTFPNKHPKGPHYSWKELRAKLKNEKSFRCQQLNQPVWGEEASISFDRELLSARAEKTFADVMKAPGYIYGAIDMAKENKQFSDYTALAIGKVYQEGVGLIVPDEYGNLPERPEGKWVMVVLDVQFGKWSQTEIVNRIAAMNDKWRPKRWYGEDIGGLQTFKEKLIEFAKTKYGHWPYIPWVPPDNSENAKRSRIKGVELLLRASRLYFLIANWNSETFDELEKYKGQKSTRFSKDDVADVLSLLAKFIPSLVSLSAKEMEAQSIQREAEYREQIRREMRKVIFGEDNGGFGATQFQWPSYEDQNPAQNEQPKSPMGQIGSRIFGRNGMRA